MDLALVVATACQSVAETGEPLGTKDFVLSCDEKTSIQAQQRLHPGTAPKPGRRRRVEPEYKRGGALQYLAT